jgi:hypothetical protein
LRRRSSVLPSSYLVRGIVSASLQATSLRQLLFPYFPSSLLVCPKNCVFRGSRTTMTRTIGFIFRSLRRHSSVLPSSLFGVGLRVCFPPSNFSPSITVFMLPVVALRVPRELCPPGLSNHGVANDCFPSSLLVCPKNCIFRVSRTTVTRTVSDRLSPGLILPRLPPLEATCEAGSYPVLPKHGAASRKIYQS